MRTRASLTLAISVFAMLFGQPAAAEPVEPATRQASVENIRELRRIVTPTGVERNEAVSIGGIKQFVSMRGKDRRNPVLPIIHGGPGFPTAPVGRFDTHGLTDYLTTCL